MLTVKLRPQVAEYADDEPAAQLSRIPIPLRNHQSRRGRQGDTWYLDELFVKIQGQQQYLWRAVDEDGDVLDILVQSRRNRRAATRFFRKLLKRQGREPRRLITDKLRSYSASRAIATRSAPVHHVPRAASRSQNR